MFHQSGLSDSDRKITKTFENQTQKPKNHGNEEKNQENRKEVNKENFKEKRKEERVQTMKPLLKTLLLCAAIAVMSGCSAQKRAQRHIRKAVALCPALVQTKAHPIDTVLSVPGFADITTIGLPEVLKGDTVYAATDHGTFVVSVNQSDSSLRVGFVAAPREVRIQDTVHYAEVSLANPQPGESVHKGKEFLIGILCFVVGIAVALYLLIRRK